MSDIAWGESTSFYGLGDAEFHSCRVSAAPRRSTTLDSLATRWVATPAETQPEVDRKDAKACLVFIPLFFGAQLTTVGSSTTTPLDATSAAVGDILHQVCTRPYHRRTPFGSGSQKK